MRDHCKYQAALEYPACADLRAMRMSDAISFVWVAATFPEHLKVQYEL